MEPLILFKPVSCSWRSKIEGTRVLLSEEHPKQITACNDASPATG